MTALAPDEVALGRIRAIKAKFSVADHPPADRGPRPAEDDLTRARRRINELELLVPTLRQRAQRFEAALFRIHSLTRRLTGQTTSAVHEIVTEALGVVDEPTEEPNTEPFE